MDKPSMLKSTLIGGAVFGLIGAIPLINIINCACCALIVGGGFLAAYLYSNDCKQAGIGFQVGAGAQVGLLAGVFYWIVESIVKGLLTIALGGPDFDQILQQLEGQEGIPPEALDTIEQVVETLSGAGGVVIVLGVGLVFALIFSTIGGLIGGAVFKSTPPAAAPPVVPSPMPPAPGGDVR